VGNKRFLQCSIFAVAVLVTGGCELVTTSHISATETAQSEAIATAVRGTLTAPEPYARIVDPAAGAILPAEATAIVEYSNMPGDRYLWVVLRVPGVGPTWHVYPQVGDAIGDPIVGHGVMAVPIFLGGKLDSGRPFDIVVLLLEEETHGLFAEYAALCTSEGECGGIQLPDTGARILDFATVIRE
jgi:hypothetical protein